MKFDKSFREEEPRDIDSIPKPSFSVQVLIFTVAEERLETVLIKRVRDPFKGLWSIPGDILSIDQSLDDAARKILFEKTGINNVYLEQLFTFGDIKRDPRGRVIATAYFALLPYDSVDLSKAPNALHAKWTDVNRLPKLAFDHKIIMETAVNRIKSKLLYSNLAHSLLPKKFRISELQNVYETVLDKKMDKRNFRKKILSLGLIEPTGDIYRDGSHRPAKLYRFKNKKLVMF